MEKNNILLQIKENLQEVIKRRSALGKSLWKDLLEQHPADIADFLSEVDREAMKKLFVKFPKRLQFDVFEEFTDPQKVTCLSVVTEPDQADLLSSLPADDLTDLFEYFSDEQLKQYFKLLHKRSQQKVLELLKFHPDSAGGVMDTEVFSLMEDFTVEKSIRILQRLRPDQEVYRTIYITDKNNRLVGHINLEDLVLQRPKARIADFMKQNDLVAQANEDQEEVAKRMIHYNLTTVPVVGTENHFLGVIPSDTLVDVIVEEAGEDVEKMAALAPTKETYIETPIYKILIGRGSVLVTLLMAESITGTIISRSESEIKALAGGIILISFITMLISTGGNASHQTSAVVVRGISSGELTKSNTFRFLRREFLIAFLLALMLATASFGRAYWMTRDVSSSFIIALTLGSIVMLAVTLGSGVPLLFNRLRIDPAFAAGPFLATFMDIVGVAIYLTLIYNFLL